MLGIFNEVNFINSDISVVLERAQYSDTLYNFLREGKDYRGLKRSIQKIVEASNLSDDEIKSDTKNIVRIAKRAIQIILDILSLARDTTDGVIHIVGFVGHLFGGLNIVNWFMWLIGSKIIGLVLRLLRLAVDTLEYNSCEKEAKQIVKLLKDKAESTDNADLKKQCLQNANKLEKAIIKYDR